MLAYALLCKCCCELALCLASSAHDVVRSLGAAILARLPIPRSILPNRYEPFLCALAVLDTSVFKLSLFIT